MLGGDEVRALTRSVLLIVPVVDMAEARHLHPGESRRRLEAPLGLDEMSELLHKTHLTDCGRTARGVDGKPDGFDTLELDGHADVEHQGHILPHRPSDKPDERREHGVEQARHQTQGVVPKEPQKEPGHVRERARRRQHQRTAIDGDEVHALGAMLGLHEGADVFEHLGELVPVAADTPHNEAVREAELAVRKLGQDTDFARLHNLFPISFRKRSHAFPPLVPQWPD